jgi:hypothetical protein
MEQRSTSIAVVHSQEIAASRWVGLLEHYVRWREQVIALIQFGPSHELVTINATASDFLPDLIL